MDIIISCLGTYLSILYYTILYDHVGQALQAYALGNYIHFLSGELI